MSGWLAPKIFHPNVSNPGEICANNLKKDWKRSLALDLLYPRHYHVLTHLPEEKAGKLLQENYKSHCERALLIMSVYATDTKACP
jgi:ubiquitin-protein ligase